MMLHGGCSPADSQPGAPPPAAHPDPIASVFGDAVDRRFDLGLVVGGPTRRLSHTFTLRNRSEERIGIVSLINGMPCCGEVEPIRARELSPGQSLEVKVTVRPSRIGPLRHWASVRTDRPELGEILLTTTADVRAPIRIEPADGGISAVTPGQNVTLHLRLVECRSRDGEERDPAPDLNVTVPGRPAQVRWEGPPFERTPAEGLTEHVRPLTVALTASEQAGADGIELVVGAGGAPKLSHQLRWNVAAVIRVSPPLLSVKSSEPITASLVLVGEDGRTFKIIDIASNLPGVVVTPRESGGARHALDVAIDPKVIGDAPRMGEIAITTDLAAQRNVRVPVLITKRALP